MDSKEQDHQRIYKTIQQRICLLTYPPGHMISENALAAEFDVSRSRMRRIFWQLEHEGLLTISRGSGAMVTAVDIKSLQEVYTVRLKLIELVEELKPARGRQEVMAASQALLEQIEALGNDYNPTELARLYHGFHQQMLLVIRNQFLQKITDQLYHQTSRVWLQLLPDLDWDEEVELVIEEIRDVLAALAQEDMRQVAQVRRYHMAQLLRRINNYLGSADTS